MQTRFFNFGDTVTNQRINQAHSGVLPIGVYQGFDFLVTGNNQFALTAGFLVLPGGVDGSGRGIILEETVNVPFTITPLPTLATVYTIMVQHVDAQLIGGQEATYIIDPNYVVTPSANQLILGYLSYPGSAVPFDQSMFYPVPKYTSAGYSNLVAEMMLDVIKWPDIGNPVLSAKGADIEVGPNFDSATNKCSYNILNQASAPGEETLVANYPLFQAKLPSTLGAPVYPPRWIRITYMNTSLVTIRIDLYDTNGNIVPLTGNIINVATLTWTTKEIQVPQASLASATFARAQDYIVRITATLDPSASAKIARIEVDKNFFRLI